MATVASTASGYDGQTSRQLRNVVALQISTTNAAILAQTGNADGFGQLLVAENEIEFAVPQLLASDIVLGAAVVNIDAALRIASANVSVAGDGVSTGKVKIWFVNNGADDVNAFTAADPVLIEIVVARR